ncbi:nuclear transport factor 2 family protein [Erythrobacter sp. YT30]|uniref:nuclear transport factor 2 family protein n=1 Tax=Erythrobacter sp. YT30 TaxID=1735012 RepID=UPI00076C21CD|nr:nuclear transport factor 2 family protein [Erythrobacter sp. YT30]KWV90602.1 hypothetical protein AUC45_15390 [Erythrobacter sp. YT30]
MLSVIRKAILPTLIAFGAVPAIAEEPAAAPVEQTQQQADAQAKAKAVQRNVDAYRARDLDRFVATFASDAEVYAEGMVAKGHKQIRALYALNFAPGAPRIKIKESGMSGPFVFITAAYVDKSGQELLYSYSEYEVIDGKITYLSSNGWSN